MKTYARIQDGLVAELLETEHDITNMFNPALFWVDIGSRVGIHEGWQFDGVEFTSPTVSSVVARALTLAELQAQLSVLSAQIAALKSRG